jgi:hypothetical protein
MSIANITQQSSKTMPCQHVVMYPFRPAHQDELLACFIFVRNANQETLLYNGIAFSRAACHPGNVDVVKGVKMVLDVSESKISTQELGLPKIK